jgi:thymidylate synthase ThyX
MANLNTQYPSRVSARVLAHSVNPSGIKIITMEVTAHRFILAELNTHRHESKNSASSRAIPVEKTLVRFKGEPAFALSWPVEQPGMSGGTELVGKDLDDAQELFRDIHAYVGDKVTAYVESHEKEHRLHKSVLNRLMEFAQWHTVILTSTDLSNFYKLRLSEHAQPEIRALAKAMKDAEDASTPVKLKRGEWHLPLFGFDGDEEVTEIWEKVKLSCARCARVSYLTHNGLRDIEADFELFDKLKGNGHYSPFEHAAQAMSGKKGSGNFEGFVQARYYIETDTEPLVVKPRKKPAPKALKTAAQQTLNQYIGKWQAPMSMANHQFISGAGGSSSNYYVNPFSTYGSGTYPVIVDPKDYFRSPPSADVMLLAYDRHTASKAMYDVETQLLKDPNSWVYHQHYSQTFYKNGPIPRMGLRWDFIHDERDLRGRRDFDLVVVEGYQNRVGVRAIEDAINYLATRGEIRKMVTIR